MRTSRIKKRASDAAALRRESPASRILCNVLRNFTFFWFSHPHHLSVLAGAKPGIIFKNARKATTVRDADRGVCARVAELLRNGEHEEQHRRHQWMALSQNTYVHMAMTKERLINSGFYDLATAYQSVHVNYWKCRIREPYVRCCERTAASHRLLLDFFGKTFSGSYTDVIFIIKKHKINIIKTIEWEKI